MKQLVSTIGDRLQAIFPPNRVMLIVAPTTTAASLWLSAWLTAHVPGVELPAGVIAGAMGVVGLIAVTLFYKWFDQWQKGESIDPEADIQEALTGMIEDPETARIIAHYHPELVKEIALGLFQEDPEDAPEEPEPAAPEVAR